MKYVEPKFKVGDRVQSVYRKRWYGVVTGRYPKTNYISHSKTRKTKAKDIYWLFRVQPTETVDGRAQPKHIKSRFLTEKWLVLDRRNKNEN